MPEGPTLVMIAEEAAHFVGKTVRSASGNARVDLQRLVGRRVLGIDTWGKHLLLRFSGFTLRVHLLLFGSYRIDERRAGRKPTLSLQFAKGEINFYASSLKYIEGDLDAAYDWSGDVLSEAWDPAAARRKLRMRPDRFACDALLDQEIFAGVGNIIKNEVLFRIRVHPLSRVGALPARKLAQLVREARQYSFDFLAWRRKEHLTRNLKVHRQTTCPRCHVPLHKAVLGTSKRRAFWCDRCQLRHDDAADAGLTGASARIRSHPPRPRKHR